MNRLDRWINELMEMFYLMVHIIPLYGYMALDTMLSTTRHKRGDLLPPL